MPAALVLALSVFAVAGVVLSVIDVRTHRVPDVIVLPATTAVLVLVVFAAGAVDEPGRVASAAAGALAAFGACLAVHFVRPAAFGGGDVKLAALVGASLGWFGPGVVAAGLLTAFAAGAVAGLGTLAAGERGAAVAFAPALVFGGWWSLARALL